MTLPQFLFSRKIRESKIKLSPSIVCEGLPTQFTDYLTYVKKLGYADTPNYTYLKVATASAEPLFQSKYAIFRVFFRNSSKKHIETWDTITSLM